MVAESYGKQWASGYLRLKPHDSALAGGQYQARASDMSGLVRAKQQRILMTP